MTKKSTIGMVLLVAMVLAKAFLFDYEDSPNDFTARDESTVSEVNAMADLRASLQPTFLPQSELIAAHISTPNLSDFVIVSEEEDNFQPVYHLEDIAVNDLSSQADRDIIPMDYVSNTGYGMWRTTYSEENASQEDRTFEGNVPLDRGNTITDNISRMFPRNP